MDIYDAELEIKALRTVCSRRSDPHCARLMARLDQAHFRHPHNRHVFRRVRSRMRHRTRPPSWSAVRTDPSISEAARKHVKTFSDVQPLPSSSAPGDYEDLFDNLDRFRQARLLWDAHEDGMKRLGEDNPDIPGMLDDLSGVLARARFGSDLSEPMRISGDDRDNSDAGFMELLSDEKPEVIPTGFKQFDDRNRGILRGSLAVVAAHRGAGKSSFAVQLAVNSVRTMGGYSVCIVPLEMNRRQMNARIYANLAGISKTRLTSWVLDPEEKSRMRKARDRFLAELKASGGSLVVDDPPMNASVEDILNTRAPYDDDMIIIDQLTLTRDASDVSNRAAQMNEAARFAKLWADANDKVVVLLTQLDEAGNVKYSRGPMEHADLSFSWPKDDQADDADGRDDEPQAVMEIDMEKARHQDGFRFVLLAGMRTGRVVDADFDARPDTGKRRGSDAGADMDMDEYLDDTSE